MHAQAPSGSQGEHQDQVRGSLGSSPRYWNGPTAMAAIAIIMKPASSSSEINPLGSHSLSWKPGNPTVRDIRSSP